jgi:DNA-directed RNA polymerase I subunit RPA2
MPPQSLRDHYLFLCPPSGPDDRDDWAVDKAFKKLLSTVGIVPMGTGGGDGQLILGPAYIPVLVDGVVFGGVKASRAADIVAQLRLLKVTGGTDSGTRLDPTTELAYIPYSPLGGAYPGLYIFTQPGRMIRPVLHLKTRAVEWIGPMEQVFMDIACLADDKRAETTHMELGPGIMLSQVASMTPFRSMLDCIALY